MNPDNPTFRTFKDKLKRSLLQIWERLKTTPALQTFAAGIFFFLVGIGVGSTFNSDLDDLAFESKETGDTICSPVDSPIEGEFCVGPFKDQLD